MFKNPAKLNATRSDGTKLAENMERWPYAKRDSERRPKETKSVAMEDQRSHKGREGRQFFEDCDKSEGFIHQNQDCVLFNIVTVASDRGSPSLNFGSSVIRDKVSTHCQRHPR